MFYSQFILAKKGPLGKIWLAAHLDKKLTKHQIFQTDIKASVESIMAPAIPIALRLSGHLLLGVCRIYSRKVFYLYSESNDALVKTKMAFKSGAPVDLPSDQQTAQLSSITLAENPNAYDLDLPPINTQMALDDIVSHDLDGDDSLEAPRRDSWLASSVSFNARKADITLAEENGGLEFGDAENADLMDPNVDQSDWFAGGADVAIDLDKDDNQIEASVDDIEMARDDQGAGMEFELDPGGAMFEPSPGGEQITFGGKSHRESAIKEADDISIRISEPGFGVEEEPDFGSQMLADFGDSVDFSRKSSTGGAKPKAPVKRRRVEIDSETEIRASAIKAQLADTSDIVREFEQAPCTRKQLDEQANAITLEFVVPLMNGKKMAPKLMQMFKNMLPETLEEEEEEEKSLSDEQPSLFGEAETTQRASKRSRTSTEGSPSAEQPSVPAEDFAQGPDDGSFAFNENDQGNFDQELEFQEPEQSHSQIQQHSPGDPAFGEVATTENMASAAISQSQSARRASEFTRAGWSKRTEKMLHVLAKQFTEAANDDGKLEFLSMLGGDASRKTAATTFFELLVLKSTNMIEVEQPSPYGEISLGRTDEFAAAANSVAAY